MKVIGLIASPRKNGNTDTVMKKVMEGARTQGAETELFYLNDLHIRGCQSCQVCKKSGKCGINDDMAIIYKAIDCADAVVIGSPVYFGRFTAQLALIMDRLYAYIKSDFSSSLAAGKKFGLVFVQRQSNPELFKTCIDGISQNLKRIGFVEAVEPLIGADIEAPDAVAHNLQYLKEALEMGKKLAGIRCYRRH